MDHGTLDHPLEPGRRLGILVAVRHQVVQLGLDIFDEVPADRIQIDIAGPHDGSRVLIVQKGQKQVLQRRVFLLAFIGECQSLVKGFFKTA